MRRKLENYVTFFSKIKKTGLATNAKVTQGKKTTAGSSMRFPTRQTKMELNANAHEMHDIQARDAVIEQHENRVNEQWITWSKKTKLFAKPHRGSRARIRENSSVVTRALLVAYPPGAINSENDSVQKKVHVFQYDNFPVFSPISFQAS